MKAIDRKKLVVAVVPFLVFFYLADKAGQAFRLAAGGDISQKVLHIFLWREAFALRHQGASPTHGI
jgi:type IV secretion system protein VirD4